MFHSSWLTELHYQQQYIIEQLNRHLGHQMVKKLVVKISTKIVERTPDMRQISQTDATYKKVTQPRNNHSRKGNRRNWLFRVYKTLSADH